MIKIGCTRIVFVFGNFVIKIPNFINHHNHFLKGCYANYYERIFTKQFKNNELINKINPTLFCMRFGLFSIQRKVEILNRNLTKKEILYFKDITNDIKKENFGYLNKKIVCIDYE